MISLPELTLLFIIGLLVLGPERLPRVASQIGRWVGRARRTANQLRYQLEREIALADLEKSSRDLQKTGSAAPEAESTEQTEQAEQAEQAEQTDDSAADETDSDDDVKRN